MRRLFVALALLALTILPSAVAAQNQPSEYATLLASLKAGKTDIDYSRLRLSYMDSPEYKAAKDTSKSEDAMSDALNKKDYPAALKNAEAVLESEYVNIDAHFVALVANQEMGAADKAAFHRTVFRGLINSIRNSGDGKSPEKAWVVINVHEEYVILRALGFKPVAAEPGESGWPLLRRDESEETPKTEPSKPSTSTWIFLSNITASEGNRARHS